MSIRTITIVSTLAGSCGVAGAQAVGYRLEPPSALTQRYCLPPCACPFHEYTGDSTGSFSLTRTSIGPLFTEYSVTGFASFEVLNAQPVYVSAYGTYRIGGEVVNMQELVLYATVDGVMKVFDSGLVAVDPAHPFPQISVTAETPVEGCRQDVLALLAAPDPSVCYPNCDQSTNPPILNVNDFICFQSRFASGDPYANCDGSTSDPVLNVNDFVCFLTRFAGGCP